MANKSGKKSPLKSARRWLVLAIVLVPLLYFIPYVAVFWIVCGIVDVMRQKDVRYDLVEKYFAGNGILTWLLSPLNLLSDIVCFRNPIIYKLDNLPAEHRAEIESCVRAFVDNKEMIKAHIASTLGDKKRGMLTFKWFDTQSSTDLQIPAFTRDYRYIKTIAISVFSTRQSTSWHFGPLRMTLRVLYNLDPINSPEVFIQCNGVTHIWRDDPLFIFDDTAFHRSVNGVDHLRYCLFMDMVRPNHIPNAFNAILKAVTGAAGAFSQKFYKNWVTIK